MPRARDRLAASGVGRREWQRLCTFNICPVCVASFDSSLLGCKRRLRVLYESQFSVAEQLATGSGQAAIRMGEALDSEHRPTRIPCRWAEGAWVVERSVEESEEYFSDAFNTSACEASAERVRL